MVNMTENVKLLFGGELLKQSECRPGNLEPLKPSCRQGFLWLIIS
jgi:hypothetical protein